MKTKFDHDATVARRRKILEVAKQTAFVRALRRENDRLRNWVIGLAVLSAVQILVIWAMILEFIVF
jgi:hypothetical protein